MQKVRLGLVGLLCVASVALAPGNAGAASGTTTQLLTRLQVAAGDLVRETSFGDRDGSRRASAEFADALAAARSTLRAKDATDAMEIEDNYAQVTSAIKAGTLKRASAAASRVLAAVNDAASKITGTPKGTTRGLIVLLAQLKASARDLQQEARVSDHAGSQRAFNAIVKLYRNSARQIKAKDASGAGKIQRALDAIGSAIRGRRFTQLERLTVSLQHVVGAVIATIERRSPGTTSSPSPQFTG